MNVGWGIWWNQWWWKVFFVRHTCTLKPNAPLAPEQLGCYGSCIYNEERIYQWYKVEIIYYSLLTDVTGITYHQLATLTSLPSQSQPRLTFQGIWWSRIIWITRFLRKLEFSPQWPFRQFLLDFSFQHSVLAKSTVSHPVVIPSPNIKRRWRLLLTHCIKVCIGVISFNHTYLTELTWEWMHSPLAWDWHFISTDKCWFSSLNS